MAGGQTVAWYTRAPDSSNAWCSKWRSPTSGHCPTDFLNLKIVIPAAGTGSRFLPTSRVVPKELLPLGIKPLIHHALEEAERAGFTGALSAVSPQNTAPR